MALAISIMASFTTPTLADTTTGNISGTVTSNGQPLAGVAVSAVAPSARYTARTDAKGFFSIVGVQPDTYTVSFSNNGYNDAIVNGVTVNPTQTTTVNQSVTSKLKVIGSTTSRAAGISAFQPQQPVDTYSVNATQINTILGKAHATSETNLLIALPGASLDKSGYPVLRGGRENDEGFQFEGIDYTDAFTSQFVNNLQLNGVNNFQLTPGAGDASIGNAGTGAINATVKRGSYPAFGSAEADVAGPNYLHFMSTEYGFAAPNGHFSNYSTYNGESRGFQYGHNGPDINKLGEQQDANYGTTRDFINNAVLKFGKDNNQSLQMFYQNELVRFIYRNNFGANTFRVGDPVFEASFPGVFGITAPELGRVTPLSYGQTAYVSGGQVLNRPPYTQIQPNETMKLQYSNTLNSSTFLTLKLYKVNASAIFDNPYDAVAALGFGAIGDAFTVQGGQRTGTALDITKQVGQKHLIAFGGKFEFVHPIDTYNSATIGLLAVAQNDNAIYDYLPATSPSCTGFLTAAFGANPCGYLTPFFPGGVPRIQPYDQAPTLNRQDFAYYLSDQFQATDKLKITMGLRVDGTTFNLPGVHDGAFNNPSGYTSTGYQPISTGLYTSGPLIGTPDPSKDVYANVEQYRHSAILQPRLGFAYQFTPRDSFTFSYGRSTQLPPISFIDNHFPTAPFAPYRGIPATANVCGTTQDRACRDYADQLFWDYQAIDSNFPYTPVKPSTNNNYDASFQHDFGHGVAVKLTPFYRRGYDQYVQTATQKFQNGVPLFDSANNPILNPPITSNAGINRTTGVEFYLTKTAQYGLSGSLSLTYINEFSNVIPTTPGEDFFPAIPPPSLALGNLYRVGFISPFNGTLAMQYKWRSGWRVNPIIGFNVGYPYGSGLLTAIGPINGLNYNVPQTNVSIQPAIGGSPSATQYVDPANPGSVFAPNIAARRGTPEGPSAGGFLSNSRVNTASLSVEYNKPNTRNTIGVLVTNLFSNVYGLPSLNTRYQPVASGIAGPRSGTSSAANNPLFGEPQGYVNWGTNRFATSPFLITPNRAPAQIRAYYQLTL